LSDTTPKGGILIIENVAIDIERKKEGINNE